jgi:hypothetical protein
MSFIGVWFAFGSQGGRVCPHNGLAPWLVSEGVYTSFLAGFLLIRLSTLFFLINKNGKPFCSFKKITLGYNVTQLIIYINTTTQTRTYDIKLLNFILFYFAGKILFYLYVTVHEYVVLKPRDTDVHTHAPPAVTTSASGV